MLQNKGPKEVKTPKGAKAPKGAKTQTNKLKRGACEKNVSNPSKKARFDPKTNNTWHGYPAGSVPKGSAVVSNFDVLGLMCASAPKQPA